uniref:inositol-polyphosphate 5-phosphatase n=1 Tax=Crassostrea virginica TaxID=6565 RepID=A0A8B8AB83_CRAVI|nr:type I inositol 1,4,5-trisphosphate 5-phosphatase-like isoform X2 [Crassostrea virginica]
MEGSYAKVLLVSANVGSIFEDPEHMLKLWLREFLKCVSYYEPEFVALHCQEVGGKNYEASMQHVNQFVKAMLGCEELQKYDRARVFLDEDYTAADKFTALGNLYFIHESLEDVSIWDFVECKFIPVEGREVLSGNIENVQIKEKAKFPQDFFPEFKWSRKGFIRTRWNVKNCVYDLVNIHLFHDASNIIAMQRSPSVYSDNRKAAFLHTLQRFDQDQYDKVPMFIFGDFNFRLDVNLLVQDLTAKTKSQQIKGKKDQVAKIVYTEEGNGKVVLTVETKGFDHHEKHSEVFSKRAKSLQRYDVEMQSYKDKVAEFEISFPPSYPFCEDVNDGLSYMKTRCPSWCDRILMSHSAKNIIVNDDKHKPKYDVIGRETCMGDHKPVYLFVNLKRSQAPTVSAPELLQLPTATEVIIPSTQVKISHVDTTKYIHIRQQNGTSTRVFRETSV